MTDRDQVRVVLVSPRNPLNIGAAARALSNFGFFHLRLVNAYDVAYREARSAVNASAVLEQSRLFESVPEAVADCSLVVGTTAAEHRELKHSLKRLEHAAGLIREHAATGGVALLFGSEKYGLSNDDLSYCHWLARIPSRPEHPSMNLGQAVAVCLYELIRSDDGAAARPALIKAASGADVERITQMLIEAAEIAGYIKEPVAESTRAKVRRMVRRLNIPVRDIEMWTGVFKQILWKLRQAL